MKKSVKVLIICLSVILVLAVALGTIMFLTSPKFLIKNDTIERVYIYHNELGRELYEFSEEEKNLLIEAIGNLQIGKAVSAEDYEEIVGGPWFSFFCEMKCGRTIQLYAAGEYLHINSVPFETDKEGLDKISNLHSQIEDKILPISPELLEEILEKRENE